MCTVESLRKCMCTRQHEREVWTEMNEKQNNERRKKGKWRQKTNNLRMRRKNCKKVNQEDLESVLVCV